jgi:long-chain acyl-CoA synthetase
MPGAGASAPWLALYDEGLPARIEPEHATAPEMFDAAVAQAPGRHLVRYFDTGLSSARVDELAAGLAAGLAALGTARHDRVALFLQNVPQFVIALVAIWRLGAIAVPCNPMLRERELARQLNDCGAVGLIALESLGDVVAATLPSTKVRYLVTTSELDLLEGDRPAILRDVDRDPGAGGHDLLELAAEHPGAGVERAEVGPDDVAMLTYTSGTTGPPKGAMNTHRNVVFDSCAFRDWLHADGDDVVLGIAPLFHITGLIAHIGLGLAAAAPLVLAHRFDPDETCGLIERHGTTISVAAITAYLALLRCDALDRHDVSSLTKAYSGGGPIPPAVVEDFQRRTGVVIHSAYGLTETTSATHLTPLSARAPTDAATGALAVGIPIFNTSTRIVDDGGATLAAGEIGEVAISGPQVVPGYWERPEETRHAIRDGELLTGDVGKMDADGWLYIVDRKKDMIVASGYKVWPREVEDVIYEHPAVDEAAVVGAPDAYRGETVRAVVSLRRGESLEAEELVAFCRERMAAYKCPRIVEIVEELPKTVSGKILRRELRTPGIGDTNSQMPWMAPPEPDAEESD